MPELTVGTSWESAGFLEKLLGPLPDARGAQVRWVGEPIRDHLVLMLNTRRGSVPGLPDYGLPDVSSYFSEYPESLRSLSQEVEAMIRKYEPRLHNARVVPPAPSDAARNEFRAELLIKGEVDERDGAVRVHYRTTISSSGHADLAD